MSGYDPGGVIFGVSEIMAVEQFQASAGLAGVVADQFLITQLGLLFAMGFLFVGALIGGAMAWGAARAARRLHSEIARDLRSTQELAAEMRNMTARAENLVRQGMAVPAQAADATTEVSQQATNRSLEKARESATVPSALLGGIMRRRR